MRTLESKGKAQVSNLFAVNYYLQGQEGVYVEVKARKVA